MLDRTTGDAAHARGEPTAGGAGAGSAGAGRGLGSIGFVGVGNMGAPMCRNLLGGGVAVTVFDQDPDRTRAAAAHGAVAGTELADVITPGGVVLSMVPDDAALERIALGGHGVLAALGAGVHLSLSTVAPDTTARLERAYRERGAVFLAATVLGRPDVAERAELTIFLAGDQAGKARVAPLLELLGSRIHDFGEHAEAANIVKLGANFLIMGALEAMAEAAGLMGAHGVDRERFLEVIAQTPLFAGAVYTGYGAMIGAQRYSPALFPVGLGLKDARLVSELAAGETPVPIAELVEAHLLAAQQAGWADQDWSVIGRVVAPEGR